ncbi:hypothetical protein FEZ51_01915 [Pediococcus stilesii]|uniref:Uncharacterized protein n=2 Tax=Pediococcus stilesii TaxID=331679 RepID=A0A5R9BYV5_9LACO|nr:hypothetical protein FEZ51_01915 [Pediococcus stilesii]
MGWVDLTDDPETVMGNHMVKPGTWWEEDAKLYAPFNPSRQHTAYEFPYVMIAYKGKDYRVSPYHIQIVEY